MINSLSGVLLASTALLAVPAAAAERWVSSSGTATSGCTQSAPCGTILAAHNAASSGDVVNVQGTVQLGAFVTTKAGIKYRCTDAAGAFKRWGCKIQPKNGFDDDDILWTNKGENVEVRGFEMDGRTPDGSHSARVVAYSTPTKPGPVTYLENHVHHGYWHGCTSGGAGLLSDASSSVSPVVNFDSNYVHDIGNSHCNQVHGIYMSTNGYVRNNIANTNGGWGIQSWHDAKENNIENNTVCYNRSGNISVGAGDYYNPPLPWTGSVVNNIVCDAPYGVNVYGSIASGQKFANNLTSNNAKELNLGSQTCTGCIDAAVKFVDASAGDFHLASGSPGIDQGLALASVTKDIDGTARPQGSAIDIGAYEFKSGGGTTPPDGGGGTSGLITCTLSLSFTIEPGTPGGAAPVEVTCAPAAEGATPTAFSSQGRERPNKVSPGTERPGR